MDNHQPSESPATSSLLALQYAFAGVAGALLLALQAVYRRRADFDASFIAILCASGALVGYVLFLTRSWRGGSPTKQLLRWTLAGAAAGGLLALTGPFENQIALLPTALGASLGALATSCLGLHQMRGAFLREKRDQRTLREKLILWFVLLGIGLVTFGLLMLAVQPA